MYSSSDSLLRKYAKIGNDVRATYEYEAGYDKVNITFDTNRKIQYETSNEIFILRLEKDFLYQTFAYSDIERAEVFDTIESTIEAYHKYQYKLMIYTFRKKIVSRAMIFENPDTVGRIDQNSGVKNWVMKRLSTRSIINE